MCDCKVHGRDCLVGHCCCEESEAAPAVSDQATEPDAAKDDQEKA